MSHARLYIADTIANTSLEEELRIQSADVEHFVAPLFGIPDARKLGDRAYVKPVSRITRDFVIQCNSLTTEAQNALLKLFEDPPETAVFHLVVQREDLLIPTLRSRLLLVDTVYSEIDRDPLRVFLRMDYGERIAEIQKRVTAKDTAWVELLVSGAEAYAEHLKGALQHQVMKTVIFLRQYIGVRGSSNKMLLEELALSLPRLK